jgi:hypothetical protein
MKKLLLVVLVAMMAFGVAGCHKGDKDADPVGTWLLSYDWGCNGTYGLATWHVHTGGVFIDSDGISGGWSVDGNSITLNYTTGYIYGGTVDGDRMDGTMTASDGDRGCWSAQRTSTLP